MNIKKQYRFLIIVFLFFLLVLVRAFESNLFYDPLIAYFKDDFLHETIPFFSGRKLLIHMSFRYFLNTIISLGIIYIAFGNYDFLKFSVKFYVLAFVFLAFAFFVILKGEFRQGYLFAFYIRRFLIHPLFVLILLPAFYYKQIMSSKLIP